LISARRDMKKEAKDYAKAADAQLGCNPAEHQ